MEVDKLRAWFEQSLHSELLSVCNDFREQAVHCAHAEPVQLLPSQRQIQELLLARVMELRHMFQENVDQCIGDVTVDVRTSLLSTTEIDITRAIAIAEDQLTASYKIEFNSWLLTARNFAEHFITESIDALSRQEDFMFTESSLRESCEEIFFNAR